ncbi:hypothetical protein CRV24_004718 [Beauveria bassiana]|nr:hypothetical protein CRV24_004718 [Beauveria bassiana]
MRAGGETCSALDDSLFTHQHPCFAATTQIHESFTSKLCVGTRCMLSPAVLNPPRHGAMYLGRQHSLSSFADTVERFVKRSIGSVPRSTQHKQQHKANKPRLGGRLWRRDNTSRIQRGCCRTRERRKDPGPDPTPGACLTSGRRNSHQRNAV